MISGAIVTTLAVLALLSIITVVFFERKNPASTMAWVMVLAFLPAAGIVAYLMFGVGFRVRKRRRYRNKAVADSLYSRFMLEHLDMNAEQAFEATHPDVARTMACLENTGDGRYTADNRAEIFTDGNDMFPRLIEDIRAAKNHVHLLFFIFREDRIGGEILSLLAEKAKQGVEVRLIYDSLGSWLSVGPKFGALRKAGGEVRAFAPLFSGVTSTLRINYRNHRKIAVIDGATGYVGGMNVGDEYMGRNPKLSPWRDTHLRLTGSSVWFLQERFLMDWSHISGMEVRDTTKAARYFPAPPGGGRLGVQIASSGPDTAENPIRNGFLNLIYGARENVYIQTPYFAPDDSLLDALRLACHSGVDVRLMIPRLSDHWLVHKATYGYARQILHMGVRIFQYDGFLHAKTVVCDGLATSIGTANMTNRSFTQNFEINAFVFDAEFNQRNRAVFLADQAHCLELTRDWFARRSRTTKLLYNVSRLVAPLI